MHGRIDTILLNDILPSLNYNRISRLTTHETGDLSTEEISWSWCIPRVLWQYFAVTDVSLPLYFGVMSFNIEPNAIQLSNLKRVELGNRGMPRQ